LSPPPSVAARGVHALPRARRARVVNRLAPLPLTALAPPWVAEATKGFVAWEGKAPQRATQEGDFAKASDVEGVMLGRAIVLSPTKTKEAKSLWRAPRVPKEFLRPSSFKASTDERSAAGV
jgi:hypothetical protein